MLKTLRKNYKIIIIGIAILTIPAFVWWGAGTSSQGGKIPNCAGIIGKPKITLSEYHSTSIAISRSLARVFGSEPSENLVDELTWNRLLLLYEIKNRRIKISDLEVRNHIEQLPHFQKDGGFDAESYQKAFGDHARSFEESIRQELAIDKLEKSITSDTQVNEEEIRSTYLQENEKIQLAYILVAIPKPESPNSGNTDNTLNSVPSEETQKMREETRKKAEEYHQALEQKINSGISSSEAFSQLGLTVTSTEPLTRKGVIPQLGYQPTLLESAFQTSEGKLGPLTEIADGFCLFWVEKTTPLDESDFKTRKDDYRKRLLEKKKNEKFNQWFSELRQKTPLKNFLADLKN